MRTKMQSKLRTKTKTETKNIASYHEITPLTMAVLAHHNENGDTVSHVLEERGEFYVNKTPSNLIAEACIFFGSSLRGRQDSTSKICGFTHKLPVSIDPGSGMYFLPTASPSNPNCSWLGHTHIYRLYRHKDFQTKLIFNNGHRIILDVSYGSMLNQVNRTAQYRYLLDSRIKNLPPRNPNPFE